MTIVSQHRTPDKKRTFKGHCPETSIRTDMDTPLKGCPFVRLSGNRRRNRMIYEKEVNIGGEVIKLCAEEDAVIRVWVNGEETIDLPLVFNEQLTITLTLAGLMALESGESYQDEDIVEVEFQNDGSRY